MGLFDKVLETGVKGLDKAKDLGEKGKAKVQIAQLEVKIKEVYEEVAKNLFSEHPDFVKENYPEAFGKFEEAMEKIEEIKKGLEDD